jgi:pyruvate dehydrogenase E2 component (dihydrolipoamide acetyltransferase)
MKMAVVEVKVPDIGDFKDVEIIELLVKPGDTVKADQSLLTVESDKASMEIPSTHGGVVKELKVKLGDKISQGSLLLLMESDAAAAPASAPAAAAAAPAPAQAAAPAPAPAAAAPAAGTGTFEIVVPDIGDFDEVNVIEVFVKPGDTLKVEQSVVTVETDKASMEIPSAYAGVVKEVRVKLGDKISKGSVLATVEGSAPAAAAAPAQAPASAPASAPAAAAAAASPPAERVVPTAALPAHEPTANTGALPHASPSIRKFARELGVPLDKVSGSGPKGRITQDDVQNFVKAVMAGTASTGKAAPVVAAGSGPFANMPAWPKVDYEKFGPVERKDLSRIQRISGPALHRNWVTMPHVAYFDDADITELEAFRVQLNKENEKSGVKVTMLAFIIKAAVASLKKFPEFNSSYEGDHLVLKKYYNIGFAADTPQGLVVPVIKDADKKGILEITKEMGELAGKARDGKLSSADMSGGTFSISSLGGIGLRYFTPLINAPEVAIAGIGRSTTEPRWDGKAFQPRLILPVSLSWDHRTMDGAFAARFHVHLCQTLTDFRRVLL